MDQINQHIRMLKQFYADFANADLDTMADIYCEAVDFADPIRWCVGLPELKRYFAETSENLSHCRFKFVTTVVQDASVVLEWDMEYSHPKLKKGEKLELPGLSMLVFSPERERFTRHRDYYDLGAMLYEHIPLLGAGVRALKRRL